MSLLAASDITKAACDTGADEVARPRREPVATAPFEATTMVRSAEAFEPVSNVSYAATLARVPLWRTGELQ